MRVLPRRLALLFALALAGCVSTHDEPFPLDDGESIALAAGGYVCDTYDTAGKRVDAAKSARLVRLRKAGKTEYAFLDEETASTEPLTLHRVKGELFIVAVAHGESPGEDLYLARFDDAGKAFQVYAESDDLIARAKALARERAVTFAPTQFSNDLAGPPASQRAFMIDLASDLKGWALTADCRAKPLLR
jgi:hypothetical protein